MSSTDDFFLFSSLQDSVCFVGDNLCTIIDSSCPHWCSWNGGGSVGCEFTFGGMVLVQLGAIC